MTPESIPESVGSWSVEFCSGSAQDLHDAEPDFTRRLVRLNDVSAPALVLGSTQSPSLISSAAAKTAGVEVASRRSGGGVVSLAPREQVWVDLFIPADDPLWVEDVTHSSIWLGAIWAQVASRAGWASPVVHSGAISDPELARLVCFAAMGAGEVSDSSRKLVGISQRRTRDGAKFQCTAYLDWNPSPILTLVDLGQRADQIKDRLNDGVAALYGSAPGQPLHRNPPFDWWSAVEWFLSELP